jgi:hypothetical protein
MKMYTVKQINDLYYVFETASENYIRKFKDKNEAWKYSKLMNRGQLGFQGWTPAFITGISAP